MPMDMCMFCAEDREIWASYECGHTGACYRCALRVRYRNKNPEKAKLCLECQRESPKIYLFRKDADHRSAANPVKDTHWRDLMYEDAEVAAAVEQLVGLTCVMGAKCGETRSFDKTSELRQHYVTRHNGVSFCSVCFEGRPLFPAEQTLYTKAQLRKHESTADRCDQDESNFYGHPRCAFCGTLHYDVEALYNHVHQKHYLCDMCERDGDKKKLVFYRGMPELIAHWREHHYYCDKCHVEKSDSNDYHPSEWVFPTDLDFAAHNVCHHPSSHSQPNANTNANTRLTHLQSKMHETKQGRGNRGTTLIVGTCMAPAHHTTPTLFTTRTAYADSRNTRTSTGGVSEERDGAGGIRANMMITFSMGRQTEVVHMNLSGSQSPSARGVERARSPAYGGGRGRGGKGGKGGGGEEGPSGGRGRGRGEQMSAAPSSSSSSSAAPAASATPAAVAAPAAHLSPKERNVQLMNKIKVRFGNNLTKFNQFRVVSADFLKGELQTADYYEKLQLFFGSDFDDIFYELVDLLPDNNKQRGLRLVHNTVNSHEKGKPDPPVPEGAKSLKDKGAAARQAAQQQQQQQQQQSSSSTSPSAAGGGGGQRNSNWLSKVRTGGGASAGRPTTPPLAPAAQDPQEFPSLPTGPKKGAKAKQTVWTQKAMQRR